MHQFMIAIPFEEKENGKGYIAVLNHICKIYFFKTHTYTYTYIWSAMFRFDKVVLWVHGFLYYSLYLSACLKYFIIKNIFLNHPSTRIFLRGITKARKNKTSYSTSFPYKKSWIMEKECLVFMRGTLLKDASHLWVSILVKSTAFSSWIPGKNIPHWIQFKLMIPKALRLALLNILFLSRILQEFRQRITQLDQGVTLPLEQRGDKITVEMNDGMNWALSLLCCLSYL